jgi:transitional endoplasmic reticulum ATPase
VETIVLAQFKKNRVPSEVPFPESRVELETIVGSSNADIEAIVLLASDYASERSQAGQTETPVTLDDLRRAMHDYLPSRDDEMLQYMELLAVFEASNRRMLPPKYAEVKVEELQAQMQALRLRVGNRR